MLRSHHHLRGFVKLVLWDVYCVNGYGRLYPQEILLVLSSHFQKSNPDSPVIKPATHHNTASANPLPLFSLLKKDHTIFL